MNIVHRIPIIIQNCCIHKLLPERQWNKGRGKLKNKHINLISNRRRKKNLIHEIYLLEMFDPGRCRGCQFHSCLTWLHKKNTTDPKRKNPRNKIRHNPICIIKKVCIQIMKNVIQMLTCVIFSEIKTRLLCGTLSISRMAESDQWEKSDTHTKHKCVCFIAVDPSQTYTHKLIYFAD